MSRCRSKCRAQASASAMDKQTMDPHVKALLVKYVKYF